MVLINTCHAGGLIDGSADIAQDGRVVLVSCRADEASSRINIPYQWIFPYFCIRGMWGGADDNSDGCISAEELFSYVDGPVQIRSFISSLFRRRVSVGVSQHPLMYDGWPSGQNNTAELLLIGVQE